MRVCSIQLTIEPSRPKEATLRHVLDLVEQARGCDLILLPELWPTGYFAFERYAEDSEPVDGALVQALQEKARALGAYIFMGSFIERAGKDLYNTCLLLGQQGQVLGRYRKMHLFGYQSQESRLLRRGQEVVVVPTPWGKAGLSICYDLRFPELYRRMVEQGAELFLICAAWPRTRLESWVLFNRARANENLAFVYACNCTGQGLNQPGGHSLFVDPLGRVMAEGDDDECLLTAEMDPAMVAQVRKEFPALHDRVLR